MKKIILLICLLLFACQSGFAGTASVFNNIDADYRYSFSDTFEIDF